MFRMIACFFLASVTSSAFAANPTLEVGTGVVEVKMGKEVVARYHFGEGVAKPYFYPLNAPGEITVTRGWPMVKGLPHETVDHVHQKSAWFCHGDVIPEGIEMKIRSGDKRVKGVDFWSEGAGHGKIVCTSAKAGTSGENRVSLDTHNEWRTPDGVKILDETRGITFVDLGTARLITLNIELKASVCPITFGDTKEGSMGIRVNDEIVVKHGGVYSNADGKIGEKEVWGQASAWCDYFGKIGEKTAGIALFDGANNKFPAYWHARGYGLMAANPFGRNESGFPAQKGKTDLVKLAKGESLKLTYGILMHTGDTKDAKVAERYAEWKKN